VPAAAAMIRIEPLRSAAANENHFGFIYPGRFGSGKLTWKKNGPGDHLGDK
jgi:hypothetical protein